MQPDRQGQGVEAHLEPRHPKTGEAGRIQYKNQLHPNYSVLGVVGSKTFLNQTKFVRIEIHAT